MNKSKRKITALLIAASMAVGCLSYAVDGHAKKALAAEINVNVDEEIELIKKWVKEREDFINE